MSYIIKDFAWLLLKDNILVNYIYWLFSKKVKTQHAHDEIDIRLYKNHSAYSDFNFTTYTDKSFVLEKLNDFSKSSGFCFKGHTSGSTNAPMPVFRSISSILYDELSLRSHWYQQGVGFNPKIATLRGDNLFPGNYQGKRYWKIMPFTRRLIMSSFHLTPNNAMLYLQELNRFKPDVILAYPSVIKTLAKLAKDRNWRPYWDVKVFTSGETFTREDQEVAKEVFPNLFDHYGQAERVARLQQCSSGNYHIVDWYSNVEIVPYGGNYKVLGSNFRNLAMPLYRYDCGDLFAGLSKTPCSCGLDGSYFSQILGRTGGDVTLKSGVRIGPAALSLLFYGIEGIKEAQLIQRKSGDLLLKYSSISGAANHETELKLHSSFKDRFGEVELVIEYHIKLERDKSGKLPPIKIEG